MTDTENANPDTTDWPLTHEDCANGPEGCDGDVAQYTSRSGATVSARCDRHQDAYDAHMDEVEAALNARYPGWDIPGSSAPADFDPTYAGESWDED